MSETTIDNLPEEVLLEVFKLLDSESLQNVDDTCDEWKEIAQTIPRTLKLDNKDMEASMDLLLESRRKYYKAVIHGHVESHPKLLEVFVKHGANIRELKFRGTVKDTIIWCQVLKTLPMLQKVKITHTKNYNSWEDLNVAELPKENDLKKLESLDLDSSDKTILKIFEKCHELKTFSPNLQDRVTLFNFLATQKCLEELTLTLDEDLFATSIPDEFIPFRLKKLKLWKRGYYDAPDYDNLLNFVKLHAGKLEELELNGQFSDAIYEFVFGKMKCLKTLGLISFNIPRNSSFYERLEDNESVSSLTIFGERDYHMISAKGLIDHLPNIEKLTLLQNRLNCRSFIEHVAETLPKLKQLDVTFFNGQAFNGLRFEALESLEIRKVNGPVNWWTFTRNNPGITELSIENSKQEYFDIHAITKNLKKLHTLTIKSGELNCNEKFFAIIRQNCKQLKSLNLNMKSLKVDVSTVADIPALHFRSFADSE